MPEALTLAPADSVQRAVDALDPADRAALALVHHHGLSAVEAAEHLGVPTTEVHRRVRAALLGIKAALSQDLAPA